jgi:hypothetical protein
MMISPCFSTEKRWPAGAKSAILPGLRRLGAADTNCYEGMALLSRARSGTRMPRKEPPPDRDKTSKRAQAASRLSSLRYINMVGATNILMVQ